MRNKMSDKDYVSLLEQTVAQGSAAAPSGPKGAGKGKGDFSKTFKEPGMGYRGVTIDGDKILNWGGDGPQYTHKKVKDIDELVETITGDKYTGDSSEWNGESPMSMLEMDELLEAEDEDEDYEDENEMDDDDDDDDDDDEDLDIDEELGESYADVNFTTTESEVISRIIKEMNDLETEADVLEEMEEVGPSMDFEDDDDDDDDDYDY